MTTTGRDGCCGCCFSFILTCGLTALFLWLSLRADEPKLYVKEFYVPALNNTLNSTSRNISFTLELENGNKDKGIRYDDVYVTFGIFLDRNTTRLIGNTTYPGFYQGHKKDAKKLVVVQAFDSINRTKTVDGKVYFRVNFTTAIKYKIMLWYTKRHHLWGGANVEVNDFGLKSYRKGIRLGNSPPNIVSGAPKFHGCYCALLGILIHLIAVGFGLVP